MQLSLRLLSPYYYNAVIPDSRTLRGEAITDHFSGFTSSLRLAPGLPRVRALFIAKIVLFVFVTHALLHVYRDARNDNGGTAAVIIPAQMFAELIL
jgi:hypothetical protein